MNLNVYSNKNVKWVLFRAVMGLFIAKEYRNKRAFFQKVVDNPSQYTEIHWMQTNYRRDGGHRGAMTGRMDAVQHIDRTRARIFYRVYKDKFDKRDHCLTPYIFKMIPNQATYRFAFGYRDTIKVGFKSETVTYIDYYPNTLGTYRGKFPPEKKDIVEVVFGDYDRSRYRLSNVVGSVPVFHQSGLTTMDKDRNGNGVGASVGQSARADGEECRNMLSWTSATGALSLHRVRNAFTIISDNDIYVAPNANNPTEAQLNALNVHEGIRQIEFYNTMITEIENAVFSILKPVADVLEMHNYEGDRASRKGNQQVLMDLLRTFVEDCPLVENILDSFAKLQDFIPMSDFKYTNPANTLDGFRLRDNGHFVEDFLNHQTLNVVSHHDFKVLYEDYRVDTDGKWARRHIQRVVRPFVLDQHGKFGEHYEHAAQTTRMLLAFTAWIDEPIVGISNVFMDDTGTPLVNDRSKNTQDLDVMIDIMKRCRIEKDDVQKDAKIAWRLKGHSGDLSGWDFTNPDTYFVNSRTIHNASEFRSTGSQRNMKRLSIVGKQINTRFLNNDREPMYINWFERIDPIYSTRLFTSNPSEYSNARSYMHGFTSQSTKNEDQFSDDIHFESNYVYEGNTRHHALNPNIVKEVNLFNVLRIAASEACEYSMIRKFSNSNVQGFDTTTDGKHITEAGACIWDRGDIRTIPEFVFYARINPVFYLYPMFRHWATIHRHGSLIRQWESNKLIRRSIFSQFADLNMPDLNWHQALHMHQWLSYHGDEPYPRSVNDDRVLMNRKKMLDLVNLLNRRTGSPRMRHYIRNNTVNNSVSFYTPMRAFLYFLDIVDTFVKNETPYLTINDSPDGRKTFTRTVCSGHTQRAGNQTVVTRFGVAHFWGSTSTVADYVLSAHYGRIIKAIYMPKHQGHDRFTTRELTLQLIGERPNWVPSAIFNSIQKYTDHASAVHTPRQDRGFSSDPNGTPRYGMYFTERFYNDLISGVAIAGDIVHRANTGGHARGLHVLHFAQRPEMMIDPTRHILRVRYSHGGDNGDAGQSTQYMDYPVGVIYATEAEANFGARRPNIIAKVEVPAHLQNPMKRRSEQIRMGWRADDYYDDERSRNTDIFPMSTPGGDPLIA